MDIATTDTKVDNGAIEANRHGVTRSPEWSRVELEHRKLQPYCICCGVESEDKVAIQVHHLFPFHYCINLGRPDLELDQRNLISLCEDEKNRPSQDHHLLIGHLDSFKSSNLSAAIDAQQVFIGLTREQIIANDLWKTKVTSRLKPLDQMTDEDKQNFINLMNTTFPKL